MPPVSPPGELDKTRRLRFPLAPLCEDVKPYTNPESEKQRKSIYIALFLLRIVSKCSDMDHSFTCKLHHAFLSFISIHQMAPPLNEVAP